jgi:hypothetical protein
MRVASEVRQEEAMVYGWPVKFIKKWQWHTGTFHKNCFDQEPALFLNLQLWIINTVLRIKWKYFLFFDPLDPDPQASLSPDPQHADSKCNKTFLFNEIRDCGQQWSDPLPWAHGLQGRTAKRSQLLLIGTKRRPTIEWPTSSSIWPFRGRPSAHKCFL